MDLPEENSSSVSRGGEYNAKGDYHRQLDKKWPYYPVYVAKMERIESWLSRQDKSRKILDVGCGEGVLVEKFVSAGYDISGLDKNYGSSFVTQGDITSAPFGDQTFDIVLCLDMLEHLSFAEQEKAISEIARILKNGGVFVCSVPNLAHLASRLSFLVRGRLIRTSQIERHIGDRPVKEYLDLMKRHFYIEKRFGLFPTFPILSFLTVWLGGRVLWLHRIYNFLLGYPNWCFLNIILSRKK